MLHLSVFAVIVAFPFAFAVTFPVEFTAATLGLLLLKVIFTGVLMVVFCPTTIKKQGKYL